MPGEIHAKSVRPWPECGVWFDRQVGVQVEEFVSNAWTAEDVAEPSNQELIETRQLNNILLSRLTSGDLMTFDLQRKLQQYPRWACVCLRLKRQKLQGH